LGFGHFRQHPTRPAALQPAFGCVTPFAMTPIDSLSDSRLSPYRNLKDRELAVDDGRFIAESQHVVRRLLASDFSVESVLVAQSRAAEIALIVPRQVALYVVPDELVNEVVGFKFHSGVIACGRRKPPQPIDGFLPAKDRRSLLVICPDLISHENLGSLIRISSAFGADAMLLGPRCCDPFYRMCIRVSMGTVFSLPILQSQDLEADLQLMKDQWYYELVAAVLSDSAQPLNSVNPIRRLGVLFGNDAQGLAAEHVELCDRQVTIPMQRGTDSLNVAVAAGIFLYELTRQG
jgi:tRNA G18 (ribose-2'-O)-methylase SpoU